MHAKSMGCFHKTVVTPYKLLHKEFFVVQNPLCEERVNKLQFSNLCLQIIVYCSTCSNDNYFERGLEWSLLRVEHHTISTTVRVEIFAFQILL